MAPFVAPQPRDDLSIDAVIDDGLLIAVSGVRLAVRNLMIVRALRENADYDEAWYLDATLSELRLLAAEKRADAARVAEYHAAATDPAASRWSALDYHEEDAGILVRRREMLLGLAERLDRMGDAEAGAIVDAARAAALDDIAGAIGSATEPPADYTAARAGRIDDLSRDIAMLHLRRSGL